MIKIHLLNNTKKKKLLAQLEEHYGINNLNYLVIETGVGKYRIFSGNLSKEELNLLGKNLNIEIIGSRLAKTEKNKIRLTFDAISIPEIKSQISQNLLEIPEEKVHPWLRGDDLEKPLEINGDYLIVKSGNDLIGAGQNAGKTLKNYIPKERRVKK